MASSSLLGKFLRNFPLASFYLLNQCLNAPLILYVTVVHKLTKNEINQNNSDFNDIQFDFWTEQIRWNI